MRCRALITKETDYPFWLARSDFLTLVHTQNYLCRDVQQVYTGAYLQDWFTERAAKEPRGFLLPTIQIRSGRIAFINGRHRTAVLVEHLDRLPVAILAEGVLDPLFRQLNRASINIGDVIELPDLPLLAKADLERFVDRSVQRIPTPNPW